MTNEAPLNVVKKDNIIELVFNRPQCHNAFNPDLLQQLYDQLIQIAQDHQLRAVVLRANGTNFSAGADLKWMQHVVNYTMEENYQDARLLAETLNLLDTLPQITIAEVHGIAIGGALGFIACCDLSVASSNASFAFSEVKIGLTPAVISPYVIRSIGAKAARRWMLTAEYFNSEKAQQMGLINQVVSATKLCSQRNTWLTTILNNAPAAMRVTKQLIRDVAPPISESIRQHTVQTIAQCRVGDEGQAGLKAFLAKQPMPWEQE